MSSSCCTPDGSCHTNDERHTTVYAVTGVHSGHCRGVITTALQELADVRSVHMEISTGRLTLTTDGEPDDALVAATVDDAGYGFTGRA